MLFLAAMPDGSDHLMRQSLDAAQATRVPGVPPDPASPTVSPDGRWLVLASYGQPLVHRYPIEGGSGEALPIEERLDAVSFLDWDQDGAIWYSTTTGLRRLTPGADSSTVPFGASSIGLQMQQILPDGRHALMVRRPVGTASGPVLVFDLRTGEETPLLSTPVVEARYTAGHLVYALPDGTLQAAPFDPDKRRLAAGAVVRIATGVLVSGNGVAQLAVARTARSPISPKSRARSFLWTARASPVRPSMNCTSTTRPSSRPMEAGSRWTMPAPTGETSGCSRSSRARSRARRSSATGTTPSGHRTGGLSPTRPHDPAPWASTANDRAAPSRPSRCSLHRRSSTPAAGCGTEARW